MVAEKKTMHRGGNPLLQGNELFFFFLLLPSLSCLPLVTSPQHSCGAGKGVNLSQLTASVCFLYCTFYVFFYQNKAVKKYTNHLPVRTVHGLNLLFNPPCQRSFISERNAAVIYGRRDHFFFFFHFTSFATAEKAQASGVTLPVQAALPLHNPTSLPRLFAG